jgi:spore germination cell wall hydrolase CwlJ-like protein
MQAMPRDVDRPLTQYIADVFFLALTAWREARGESYEGQLAVAYSILNRVQRPSWWGDSVQSVVTKKWQYSSLTDPKDAQLAAWPREDDVRWRECMQIALDVVNGDVGNPVPGADSYYAVSIPAPKWATQDRFVRQIGNHRFYNLDRDVEKGST